MLEARLLYKSAACTCESQFVLSPIMESDIKEHLARTPRLVKVQPFVDTRGREVSALTDAVKSSTSSKKGYLCGKRRALRSYNRRQYGQTYLNEEPGRSLPSKSKLKRFRKRKCETMQRDINVKSCDLPHNLGGNVNKVEPRMLETYRWHVKRYKIVDRWNHRLAIHFNGKGNASMSFLARIPNGCIAHDASYWCAFHVCGAVTDIISGLKTVSSPSCIAEWLDVDNAYKCPKESVIPIHKRNSWPSGLIAPVKVLWIASSIPTTPQVHPRLVIWVHCSAYKEAMDEIMKCYRACDLQCEVKEALNLRRLEICGQMSMVVLQKVLVEVEGSTNGWAQALGRTDELHDGQAFVLLVKDPRLAHPLKMEAVQDPSQGTADRDKSPHEPVSPRIEEDKAISDAWADFDQRIGKMAFPQPHSTNRIGKLRKSLTRSAMGLASASVTRRVIEGSQISIGQALSKPMKSYSVPVIAIYRRVSGIACWSLIIPSGWMLPCWKEITLSGAFTAGLWEWRWLMAKLGRLSFPFDFPDCQAYLQTQVELNDAQNVDRAKRPRSNRHPPCSFPPPWMKIGCGLQDSKQHADEVESPMEIIGPKDMHTAREKGGSGIFAGYPWIQLSVEYCRVGSKLSSSSRDKLMPFQIKMLGKGVCNEGASVHEVSTEGGTGHLLGFVTTSFPRGMKPFPGGFAVCRVSNTTENARVVWLLNAKATKPRKAHLQLVKWDHWGEVIL